MGKLLPQADEAGGMVTVEALWNNGERPIGRLRQDLLEHATSQYVCFVDDDDDVPADYVKTILPLLDGVDYVGFKVEVAGGSVVEHSLRHSGWDGKPGYRDLSHLNPLRRQLALQSFFDGSYGEDRSWASQLRGLVLTEHFLDRVMYFYLPAGEMDDLVLVRISQQMSGPHGSEPAWPSPGSVMVMSWSEGRVLCQGDGHGGTPIAELLGPAPARPDRGRYVRPVFSSPYFSWHPGSSEGA